MKRLTMFKANNDGALREKRLIALNFFMAIVQMRFRKFSIAIASYSTAT